jgi:hypothetical protein
MARRVICVPSEDVEFCDAVTGALNDIDGQVREDDLASVLADSLRRAYPAVTTHRQYVLARIPRDDVWYAYRDGLPPSSATRIPGGK